MAGFFRKVAGAFVELPPASPGPQAEPTRDEVEALLDQLGTPAKGQAAPPPPTPAAVDLDDDTDENDALTVGPDELFTRAGLLDGPNSALRLIKIVSGLAVFPPEQQLAMVRALDAADSSWNEGEVLGDARARQQALRGHLDGVEREHARRLAAIGEAARQAQAHGAEMLADIDRQIAELQALRNEALNETAQAVAALDGERRDLDNARDHARRAVSDMSTQLSSLITFFAGRPNGQ